MIWILTLITYLWIMGGLGWAAAYEDTRDHKLTMLGKSMVVLLWPLFAFVAAIGETVEAVRELRA